MGIVLHMSDEKSKRAKAARGGSAKDKGVVAGKQTKIRDVEDLLRYVKWRDDRRG